MKALSYLLITQLKNRILSLKKKPAFLILYVFIILIVLVSVIMVLAFGNETQKIHFADERILYLVISGFGFLYLMLFVTTGLSTGSSLFSMADVGLLFVAPISSKKILIYGLLSTMGKALLASLFIFGQVGNLKINFGYGSRELIALFLIYAIMFLFSQLLSIAIYIFTNGNSFRKYLVKIVLYTIIGLLLLSVIILQKQEQINVMEAFFRTVDSKWFGYVPIAGWATMFFKSAVGGILSGVLISLAFFIFFSILITSLLTVGTADYYEDVLLSTEVAFQTRRTIKESGRYPARNTKRVKVREEDRSILKGSGAMTLAYKHILEMKRRSRFIFVDGYTVFVTIAVGIAGYNFKNTNAAYGILGFIIYFQYFLTVMGKLKQELLKPYIYMIPETSIKKVFAASLTSMIKPCVDAVCMFTVFGIVGGADIMTCIFFMLAYSASGAVFVGFTILYQRVLGGQPNKIIQAMIGIVLLLSIMTPAIVSSVVAAFLLPEALDFLCTLPYTIFCVLFALLIFVTCGNLIDKAEYTGK